MSKFKYVSKKFVLFFIVIIICFAARIFSSLISAELVRDNMYKYLNTMEARGASQFNHIQMPLNTGENSMLDFYSENAYLHVAFFTDPSHPLKASVENTIANVPEDRGGGQALYDVLSGVHYETTSLPTYWFGAVTLLRPMLALMEYDKAITLLSLICIGLAFYTFSIIGRDVGRIEAAAFLIGILGVNFINSMMLIFNIMTFFVAFIGTIVVIKYGSNDNRVLNIFLVLGIVTAYFDWFTTPIITFLYPFMMVLVINYKSDKLDVYKQGVVFFVKNGFTWAFGYGAMILSKWIIADIVLGGNVIARGLTRFSENKSRSAMEGVMSTPRYIYETFKLSIEDIAFFNLFSEDKVKIVFIAITIAIIILVGILFVKGNKAIALVMLLCCLVPVAWVIVFHGHVYAHHYYDYRSFAPAITGLIICIYDLITDDNGRMKYNVKFNNRSLL